MTQKSFKCLGDYLYSGSKRTSANIHYLHLKLKATVFLLKDVRCLAQNQSQEKPNSTLKELFPIPSRLAHITDGDQGLRFNVQTLKPLIAQGWGTRWVLSGRGWDAANPERCSWGAPRGRSPTPNTSHLHLGNHPLPTAVGRGGGGRTRRGPSPPVLSSGSGVRA